VQIGSFNLSCRGKCTCVVGVRTSEFCTVGALCRVRTQAKLPECSTQVGEAALREAMAKFEEEVWAVHHNGEVSACVSLSVSCVCCCWGEGEREREREHCMREACSAAAETTRGGDASGVWTARCTVH